MRRVRAATLPTVATRSIFVADDDPATREVLARLLRGEGYRVRAFASGGELLRVLATDRLPDLVLLDVRMPGLSGSEVLSRLASDPRTSRLSVFVISGEDEFGYSGSARVRGFFRKPLDIDDLLSAVRAFPESGRTPLRVP